MKRPEDGALLVLLLIIILLLTACLPVEERESHVQCKLVVGDSTTYVRVYYCRDYETNACFYVSEQGNLLETTCVDHIFAEVPNERYDVSH